MKDSITGLIFDMDGVLIDSSIITIRIISDLLSGFERCPGKDPQRIRETFGMSMADMWNYLMPGYSWKEQKRISDQYDLEIESALFHERVLLPGVRDTLESLRQTGLYLTVASNCGSGYLNAVLDSQKIRQYFEDPQCLQSVGGTKKSDIIRHHIGKNPRLSFAMVGDRRSDIEAAADCGIPGIGCRSAFGTEDELRQAVWIIDTIKELRENIDINVKGEHK